MIGRKVPHWLLSARHGMLVPFIREAVKKLRHSRTPARGLQDPQHYQKISLYSPRWKIFSGSLLPVRRHQVEKNGCGADSVSLRCAVLIWPEVRDWKLKGRSGVPKNAPIRALMLKITPKEHQGGQGSKEDPIHHHH